MPTLDQILELHVERIRAAFIVGDSPQFMANVLDLHRREVLAFQADTEAAKPGGRVGIPSTYEPIPAFLREPKEGVGEINLAGAVDGFKLFESGPPYDNRVGYVIFDEPDYHNWWQGLLCRVTFGLIDIKTPGVREAGVGSIVPGIVNELRRGSVAGARDDPRVNEIARKATLAMANKVMKGQ